jgi:hypothetical protein
VSVDTGHKTNSNGSAERLSNLALVDRSQAGFGSVSDTAHAGHIFGHNGEIL